MKTSQQGQSQPWPRPGTVSKASPRLLRVEPSGAETCPSPSLTVTTGGTRWIPGEPSAPSAPQGMPAALARWGDPRATSMLSPRPLSPGPGTPFSRQCASVGSAGGLGLAGHRAAGGRGRTRRGGGARQPCPRPIASQGPPLTVLADSLGPLPSSARAPQSLGSAGLCHCPRALSVPPGARAGPGPTARPRPPLGPGGPRRARTCLDLAWAAGPCAGAPSPCPSRSPWRGGQGRRSVRRLRSSCPRPGDATSSSLGRFRRSPRPALLPLAGDSGRELPRANPRPARSSKPRCARRGAGDGAARTRGRWGRCRGR